MKLKSLYILLIVVMLSFVTTVFAKQRAVDMTRKSKGTLYIISAASGTGKTSLIEALVKNTPNIKFSISHTTRQARGKEVHGKDYFFIKPKEFEALIEKGEFLEHAKVFDDYYGTSKNWVEEQLNAGNDVVLDIDWQGARQVKEKTKCITIFLLPPSKKELRARLEKRDREGEEIIKKRLAAASSEISHYKEFDYIVINDRFEDALADLQTIAHNQRLRLNYQANKYATLIKELLSNSN